MKQQTLTCHCGCEENIGSDVTSSHNVLKAGWGVLPTFDGKLIKVCPICFARAKELANEMYQLTGSRYISLSNLIRNKD